MNNKEDKICLKYSGKDSIEISPVVIKSCDQCLEGERINLDQQTQAVFKFATRMLIKLELRSQKNNQGPLLGKQKDYDIWHYILKLKKEVKELEEAVRQHGLVPNSENKESVISECCDVANFAAAVAEKVQE